jgi:voltage-gated potassium channel
MKKLDKIIDQIKSTRLEEFSLEILIKMAKEITKKQEDLFQKAKKIKNSIDGISIHQSYYGTSGILPNEFSTPLKKILTEQREMRKIDKCNQRYKIELKRINNLINEKKLKNEMESRLGSSSKVIIKDIFLMILIIFVLFLMGIEFFKQGLTESILIKMFIADSICCLIFLSNFYFELKHSSSKKWYFKTHWIDLVTSIPIPDAGILRSGRIVRLVRLSKLLRLSRVLKLFRLIFFFWRGMSELEDVFDIHLAKKAILYCGCIAFIGGLLIFQIESGYEGGGIDNFVKSLWWSFSTLIGGGDAVGSIITNYGKILTVILIIAGMILIGVLTSALTTLMVGDESEASLDTLRMFMDKKFKDFNRKDKSE